MRHLPWRVTTSFYLASWLRVYLGPCAKLHAKSNAFGSKSVHPLQTNARNHHCFPVQRKHAQKLLKSTLDILYLVSLPVPTRKLSLHTYTSPPTWLLGSLPLYRGPSPRCSLLLSPTALPSAHRVQFHWAGLKS